ncbi:MAG TPA: hypothetical protein VLG09_03915 [Candidatus Saccharimonadales bacterium]|nr:hypothetical protein [Candidatus Saccharimonadales bacterium]
MTYPVPQDTPIKRVSIRELTADQLEALVMDMRERRMRLFSAYEEAKAAKAKLMHDKAVDRYQHVIEMFEKKIVTVDNGLDMLNKYATELQALRIIIGEQ